VYDSIEIRTIVYVPKNTQHSSGSRYSKLFLEVGNCIELPICFSNFRIL